ncbi:MAG: hypothetical protein QG597_1062 [Actinomycetota bacterium]|nr:hypothetical protein [Actinomycetota bacterium]
MTQIKAVAAATTIGAVALAVTGCGGSSSSTVTVTATAPAAETSAAAPASTASSAPKATASVAATATEDAVSFPAPPAGSTTLQTSNDNGVEYARYSNASEQPAAVVSYYSGKWQAEGYTMTNTGGGGGGYGKYGGADAGAEGSKSGSYVNVQSGGSTSGPTYFEVCMGSNQSAVNECGNQSNSGSS